MLSLLCLLTMFPMQTDSVRLPTAMRAAISQMIADVNKDPAARASKDIFIDVGSFRLLLGTSESEEFAWKQLPLAGGPKAIDRSKEQAWGCAPGSADRQTPCLPIPQGRLLIYAVKQTREGPGIRVGMNASWSIWNAVKGQLTGVGTSYEAYLEPSARGWVLKSVKRVAAFSK